MTRVIGRFRVTSTLTTSAVALFAAFLLAASASAQIPEAPRRGAETHALTNARIMVAPGRVIEHGTVVIRDGRVHAVGTRVDVPSDARVLDLAGLTVYPGLIDAAASAPLHRAQPPPEGAAPLDPGRVAADLAELSDAERAAWRAVGVTTLGLAYHGPTDARWEPGPQYQPIQGDQPLLPGRTSVVSVGAGPLGGLVIPAPAAVQIGFGTRRIHEYPVTLMGAIAFVHQAFLDAAHQRRLKAAHARDPSSVAHPVFRPQVEPLEAASAGEERVWITVFQENNLKQAIQLGDELALDYVLLGAQEGYRIAERLARTGRPVLVSLDWPRPEQVTGRSYELHIVPVAGLDAELERADLAAARALRANPAALVQAGVLVALTSYGLRGPGEFRARVLSAIEAGISPDDALRALTVTPARILGLERELGTIEAGKMGNMIVVDGELFSPEARIRHVFVEGRRFDATDSAEARRPDAYGARR